MIIGGIRMNNDTNVNKVKVDRKFKCPFCNKRDTKSALVSHVEQDHEDMIPETFTAARVVYNYINNRTTGNCVVCKKETEWDENRWKYKRLCNNPNCKKTISDKADANMIKTYGTKTLLNDPEQQEKMLFNRSISGEYKFSDKGIFKYVGSYERKALEFMDKVLEISSNDLLVPGPVINYSFEGKELMYISDMYYIPYNLIIEIKDGGSNPNNRQMESYRNKQKAKENTIIKDKKYNYIRLTDNQFDQLLDIFAELKYNMMTDTDNSRIVRIHEEVGGIPSSSDTGYIISYGYNNVFDNSSVEGYGYSNNLADDKLLIVGDDKLIKPVNRQEFLYDRQFSIHSTKQSGLKEFYINTLNKVKDSVPVDEDYFFVSLVHSKPILEYQLDYDTNFSFVDLNENNKIASIIESTILSKSDNSVTLPIINIKELRKLENVLKESSDIRVFQDNNGYFAKDVYSDLRTKSYISLDELEKDNIIEVLKKLMKEENINGLSYI